jgi:uncharacterized metal-binding protein
MQTHRLAPDSVRCPPASISQPQRQSFMLELAIGLTLAGIAAAVQDRLRRKLKPIPVRQSQNNRPRGTAK